MKDIAQIIGLVSAALTTAAFVPQAVKTWRTRSTSDLSPLMFSLFCIGIAGWLVYGILVRDLPIMLANIVTICLAGSILFFIIRGDRSKSVGHIGLYVNDLEAMKDFYCRNLMAKAGPLYHNPKKKFTSYFIHFAGNCKIELMHQEGRDRVNEEYGHIALKLGNRQKVDSLTRQLASDGIKIISEPRITGDGYYESLICDPEGNYIELTT